MTITQLIQLLHNSLNSWHSHSSLVQFTEHIPCSWYGRQAKLIWCRWCTKGTWSTWFTWCTCCTFSTWSAWCYSIKRQYAEGCPNLRPLFRCWWWLLVIWLPMQLLLLASLLQGVFFAFNNLTICWREKYTKTQEKWKVFVFLTLDLKEVWDIFCCMT